MAPSSRFALSLNPNVAYLVLNLCALWKKQTTLPSLAYAGIPYQVLGLAHGNQPSWYADRFSSPRRALPSSGFDVSSVALASYFAAASFTG